MIYISDETIENLIKEDIPYIDLTTSILGITKEKAEINFISRENAIISGSEKIVRIFNKLGVENKIFLPSGSIVKPGDVIFMHAQE